MKTGRTVAILGLYSTECCSTELIFDLADTFSRCPQCQHLCEWEYEQELVTLEDLDRLNGRAA